ncbi:uncharacterized protein LOC134194970 isoform X2 [Corticium candelabrum]|uniref:uncharacterized protein LOC134194970 isoform X2 n=1 Tax=Corticium candelabrum TaxID=121492 RepID=UPI002E26B118|nr:uncharacterized protein LOC134194970 isoform X2 [Corticium candelabrum]
MTSGECSISRSSVHVANRRPLDLLRAHWVELEDRVWADHITGELFKREIISMMDREKIERKARDSRREGAVLLLEIMMTRSWCECVEFAVIVSETEGLKDLGEKLVKNAAGDAGQPGVRDGQDKGTIVRENRRLKRESESLMTKMKRADKKERGERLLRVGLEMERVSEIESRKRGERVSRMWFCLEV